MFPWAGQAPGSLQDSCWRRWAEQLWLQADLHRGAPCSLGFLQRPAQDEGRRKGKPDFLEKEMKGGCPELSYGGRCLLQQERWRIENRGNPPLPTPQRIKRGKDTKEPARGRRNETNSLVWGQGLFLPSSLILSLPPACCSGSRAESPGGRGGWVGSVKAT